MPYIPFNDRAAVEPRSESDARTAGELNYQLTILIDRYLTVNEKGYQTMNDIVGALDGAKAEFQRRVVAPYEDKKIAENGDVYWRNHVNNYM